MNPLKEFYLLFLIVIIEVKIINQLCILTCLDIPGSGFKDLFGKTFILESEPGQMIARSETGTLLTEMT